MTAPRTSGFAKGLAFAGALGDDSSPPNLTFGCWAGEVERHLARMTNEKRLCTGVAWGVT